MNYVHSKVESKWVKSPSKHSAYGASVNAILVLQAFLSFCTIGNVLFIMQEAIHKTQGLTVPLNKLYNKSKLHD